MKLLAINGSPRKGNTYRALNTSREAFPDIDMEILQLTDMDFQLCKGCYTCVTKGEDKCRYNDDKEVILEKIKDADGLILASPAYSHMVTAIMKNFVDRFAYMAHRPELFDKYAMAMTTCSGYGGEEALKYMNKMLSIYGFSLAPGLELQVHPGPVPEKTRVAHREKSIKAVEALVSKIEKGERDKPTLGMMIPFQIFKYASELARDVMPADYEYYKDKKDYFYETRIPGYQKFIAKRVSSKITSKFHD
jgi:multimeric flavodoxin WrbA